MDRDHFMEWLRQFMANNEDVPATEHLETLRAIEALARTLPNGFILIETGKPGSAVRVLEEINVQLKAAIARIEARINEGVDDALGKPPKGSVN